MILAHRGLALEHFENTLGAFQAAVDAGASALELDVHLSSDGRVMVFHDRDLSRVWQNSSKIRHLTAAQLAGFGSGKNVIPTLDQIIEEFPNVTLNIDVKVREVAEPLARVIDRYQIYDRIRIASFSRRRRRLAVKSMMRPVAQSASSFEVLGLLLSHRMRWSGLAKRISKSLDSVQIPTRFSRVALDRADFITWLKRHKLEVHFWSINEPFEMSRLISLGATGIVTDRCDIAGKYLQS